MHDLIVAMFTILRLIEDSSTDNLKENAIGPYQIRPIFVEDVNRIASTRFVHEDARHERKAQQMIYVYLMHYGARYEGRTGQEADASVLGRIFNGGPFGYTKEATKDYGERCQNLYEQWVEENE
jgi:hypothetical protein